MQKFTTCAVTLLATFITSVSLLADTFGSGDNQFDIEFLTIGDPGNPPYRRGNPNPAGRVGYVYRIGKYEISREMVEKASDEGGLGLTLDPMDFVTGAIGNGPRSEMPATGVSWNEAARFVNWLNESEGFAAAYKFATQPGDAGYNSNENILLWERTDAGYDPANRFRNSRSQYFLPSVHEWYKAAFYDPDAGGETGGYWDFPTGSDSVPTAVANGTDPGTAVWEQSFAQGPADITQAGGLSSYGVMGQAGNVWEWEETEFDLRNDSGSSIRGVRGGGWSTSSNSTFKRAGPRRSPAAAGRPSRTAPFIGFRVASVPEPSSVLLAAMGAVGLLLWRQSLS